MINFNNQNLLFSDFLKIKKNKMFLIYASIQEKNVYDTESLLIFGIFGEKKKLINFSRKFIFQEIDNFAHQKVKEKDLFYYINFLSFKKEEFLDFLKKEKLEPDDELEDLLFDFLERNNNSKTILG